MTIFVLLMIFSRSVASVANVLPSKSIAPIWCFSPSKMLMTTFVSPMFPPSMSWTSASSNPFSAYSRWIWPTAMRVFAGSARFPFFRPVVSSMSLSETLPMLGPLLSPLNSTEVKTGRSTTANVRM